MAERPELARDLYLLTVSRLRVYQTCRAKHDYKYWMRRSPTRPDTGIARRFGSMFHDAQEAYWRALERGGTLQDALDAATVAIMTGDADPFIRRKCLALIAGYHFRWERETERWRVVAVEAEFRLPLINPRTRRRSTKWEVGGKIDLIIEILDGPNAGLWVVEHKTSTEDVSPGSVYWRRLRLDQQCTVYIDGARSLGYLVRGVIYDVAKRPMLEPLLATPEESRQYTQPKPERPGKPCKGCKEFAKAHAKQHGIKLLVADIPITKGCPDCTPPKPAEPSRLYSNQRDADETPDDYFERVSNAIADDPDAYFRRSDPPVVRLDDELDMMRQAIWDTAHSMNVEHRGNLHPINPSACKSYNSLCDYFDACVGDAQIDDPEHFTRRDQVHPELAPEPKEDHDSSSQEEAA